MEGYTTTDAVCSKVVQQFVGAWVAKLHALGYLAGVYGSAASTIRDMIPLTTTGAAPDQVDIGNWNGNPNVFGDPYVPDSYWPDHQRIHQYRPSHNETYGGVTINIDNDSLDAAVATTATPAPASGPTPAGSTTSPDGLAVASWSTGALSEPATITLAPSTLERTQAGFAAGSYLVQLTATPAEGGAPLTSFAANVSLRFTQPTSPGTVPALSSDGHTWTVLLHLPRARLPAGATAGYTTDSTSKVTILTRVPAWFGLLRDVGTPTRPATPTGQITGGTLHLHWAASRDNSGTIAGYQILRNGNRVANVSGNSTSASIRPTDPNAQTVFRVIAIDAAANASIPSAALVVTRRNRPADAPAAIPTWAWQLINWLRTDRHKPRPETPHPIPTWFWHWATWQLQPYRVIRNH